VNEIICNPYITGMTMDTY